MYLVHVELAHHLTADLPNETSTLISSRVAPEERVEHVVAHAQPRPVIGIFLIAESLASAERTAAVVVQRTLNSEPSLEGWRRIRVESPLLIDIVDDL